MIPDIEGGTGTQGFEAVSSWGLDSPVFLYFSLCLFPSTIASALKSSGTLDAERCPFGLCLSTITYNAVLGAL